MKGDWKRREERARQIRDEHVANSAIVPYFDGNVVVPEKVNPAIPDHIWTQFQNLGGLAAGHLERLLTSEKFKKLPVPEQVRVIELAFSRAYGSIDGAVRRNLHVHVNPEDNGNFNALSEMAQTAQHSLPEFKRSSVTGNGQSVDMERRHRTATERDTLDMETPEDTSGSGD